MKTVEIETTPSLEQRVAKIANEKALSASWNINILILANALLVAVVLMGLEGVAIEILAPVAAIGIGTVWFISRIRRKRLYDQFYEQELEELEVVTRDEEDEVPRIEKKEAPIESPLSLRESEILSRIASGYLNKQVATEFGISEHTIKNHMTHILEKLEVCDRTHAVVIAMQNGWISPVSTVNTTNGKSGRNSVKQYLEDDSSSVTVVQ
jgi:DNA-binding CsgD family transcriptional regulator